MAATCRFMLPAAPPMLRDRARCRRLQKISTWSELQYLAISNRCTRNWGGGHAACGACRRAGGVCKAAGGGLGERRASTAPSWRGIFNLEPRGSPPTLGESGRSLGGTYVDPDVVRGHLGGARSGLAGFGRGQGVCFLYLHRKQAELLLHGHLPGPGHLPHELQKPGRQHLRAAQGGACCKFLLVLSYERRIGSLET